MAVRVLHEVYPVALERAVDARLIGVHGVRVVASGALEHDQFGHAQGTPYVEIAAHSVQAADFAEAALADIARLPIDVWQRGWSRLTEDLSLRIFPELELV